jgi:epoxide hydrolase-like predicted phosphatase
MVDPQALVVDWGGVLTSSLRDTMTAWCSADDLDYVEFRKVMKDWLGTSNGEPISTNPIHALERGELDGPDFERELAARLLTRDGQPVEPDGLLTRMFSGFTPDVPMVQALRSAKAAGLRTALLSNSWGNEYAREGWEDMFDVVVISGEVKMRKPERQIYELTIDRLGLEAPRCVFVDDLSPNIRAAVDVGMHGVLHHSAEQTLDALEALFGVSLRP